MHTIVIKVWRGLVSEVYSDDPNTEIVILDEDRTDVEDIPQIELPRIRSTDAAAAQSRSSQIEDRRLRAAFLVAQRRRTWPRVGLLGQARLPVGHRAPAACGGSVGATGQEKKHRALCRCFGSTAAYLSMMFAAIWMFPPSSVLRRTTTVPSPAR